MSDWQLSQTTVDFRNEERRAANAGPQDPPPRKNDDDPCPCGATINDEPATIHQCGCSL